MSTVIRRAALAAGLALGALALAPATATASGGGGCGQPVSDGVGTEVDIRDYCFSPTILRVATGDAVTFTNKDRFEHSVLGANATWGDYNGFRHGKALTYRFEQPGVYPYVCTYHVGMVGVIVVGSGAGGAIDTTTGDGPVLKVDPAALELRDASALPPPNSSGRVASTVVWSVAAVLVVTGAVVLRRRHVARAGGSARP
ncbi:MAG TPA: plastocyanin/azurin family copper-binding protein [Actinomycetota bacterium]|nr:plastocyanin/azurin family copper-binding protein [Actinomycetota bacterium]